MSKPLFYRGGVPLAVSRQVKKIQLVMRNNKILFTIIAVVVIGLSTRLWNDEPVPYVHASSNTEIVLQSLKSPLFEQPISSESKNPDEEILLMQILKDKEGEQKDPLANALKNKLYEIVGDAPIREMVPYISQRDEKVAAFLVGIAKKESSFGSRSPQKDGETCYNYWGYKSSGERGTASGYACFASAEEAVKVVGDRIEVLVNRDRNTPARMVNTWKCGTSCAGDPGAPSWVSTVKLYFDKIVG